MDADLLSRLEAARQRLAEERVGLSQAAQGACLSPFHFHRQFVRAFGQTPHAFATGRRLDEARRLLLTTDLPVGEVVLEVGYESLGSFSTRFAREFGLSPREFREGARRLWSLGGIKSHRFVPLCYVQYGKIREAAAASRALV